jgi:6-phosphofructokinase 2
MSRIITITFNPCIDKTTTVDALMPEKKLRCSPPVFQPGGGGINVSRGLKRLGTSSVALYPAGGYSGQFLQKLVKEEGIDSKVVDIKSHTRENLIVVDQSSNQQYRFGMPGPSLEEQEWQECLNFLQAASGVEYIVASGSLSPGIPEDIYGRIASIAREKKARLIVDTSGTALEEAVNVGVFMIKPNLGELSSLVGRQDIHAECVDDVAKDIIQKGKCELMMISLGQAGAMLVSKDQVVQMMPPVVKRKSTVGAGDSMVAGIVHSISSGHQLKEALRFGIACGTAATLNEGTELFHKEDVEKLLPLVREVAVR